MVAWSRAAWWRAGCDVVNPAGEGHDGGGCPVVELRRARAVPGHGSVGGGP